MLYKSRGSHHFSGLNNLLDWLRELRRKPVYSLDYHFFFFIKRILKYRNQQPDEEILGQNTGKGQSLQALLRPTTFPILHVYRFRSSPNPRNFISWAQLIMAIGDRFNLQAFSPSPTGGASETESSSLITWFSWQLAPSGIKKSPFQTCSEELSTRD